MRATAPCCGLRRHRQFGYICGRVARLTAVSPRNGAAVRRIIRTIRAISGAISRTKRCRAIAIVEHPGGPSPRGECACRSIRRLRIRAPAIPAAPALRVARRVGSRAGARIARPRASLYPVAVLLRLVRPVLRLVADVALCRAVPVRLAVDITAIASPCPGRILRTHILVCGSAVLPALAGRNG
jgi:hypothetical protein